MKGPARSPPITRAASSAHAGASASRGSRTSIIRLVEVDEERGVVRQLVGGGAAGAAAAPLVARVANTREHGAVDEGLVDPEAVPAIGRVPRVGALLAAEMPERVAPARPLDPVNPPAL